MNWRKITMVDGWTIRRDSEGYTLTAQIYALKMDDLPTRGNAVTTDGQSTCAVPSRFKSYLVTESEITPLTSEGPFLATVTAKAHLSASGQNSDSLLSQNSVTACYQDFHIEPWYCCLAVADANSTESGRPDRIGERFVSDYRDDKKGVRWNSDKTAVHDGCPFSKRPHYRYAGETLRFLAVTVKFNRLEGSGIEHWANFNGIVPVNSMPKWIKIPHGDNRWRLWDEVYEMAKDTDGKRILSVTRVLLGIPANFKDMNGNRCQWNQSVLGQKNWEELE